MKKHIIASDYDGTLRINGEISPKVIDAIQKFRSRGHLFGIVTGRPYEIGYEVFKNVDKIPFDFIVMCSGSSACDNEGNFLFVNYAKGDAKIKGTTVAKQYVMHCLELINAPCGISLEKELLRFHPDLPNGGELNGRKYVEHCRADNVGDFVMSNITCDTVERATEVTKILTREFGEYLNPQQNGRNIDCPPIGVNKATGLKQLAKTLGLDTENVWTVGDNYNDIDMLEKYHGCAISSGVEAIRSVSEYVCDDVADVVEIVLNKCK